VVLFVLGCGDATKSSPTHEVPANEVPEKARKALRDAESFELLSIDPERQRSPPAGHFHGYKVLGKTKVEDAAGRAELVTALEKGATEGRDPAHCFNPRHAIRVTSGDKTSDFLICFECSQVKVLETETTSVDHPDARFLISRSPQPEFDQALRDAGLPLAKE
jgi:hypothetical protein